MGLPVIAPDISVVICAYTESRWRELTEAVESMHRQTLAPREIYVVVDHNPALLERARTTLPGVAVVENSETRGLSGARNSGIAAAQGQVVAFMDEDALAAPDWLAQLSAGYADPRVVGVGGAINPMWLDGRPAWFPDEFLWVVGCTYRGMPEAARPVRNLIGCNMSFRRDVFAEVGGFRSGIGRIGKRPVGCEETELCIRAHQRRPAAILLYEPRAKVFHRVTAERTRTSYFYSRCYSEGLSKSLVSYLVGPADGLAAEWDYTLKTLPAGIARGMGDLALRRDWGGPARAGAIAAGLVVTSVGYLVGTLTRFGASQQLRQGAGGVVRGDRAR